ncbi:MAG: hypothetical protein K2I10_11305 [Lachnospiraceae bacterium]|nr:hypothetical protein [Lachnospiraceae bacterium]
MTKQRTSFPYWKRCSLFSISGKEDLSNFVADPEFTQIVLEVAKICCIFRLLV